MCILGCYCGTVFAILFYYRDYRHYCIILLLSYSVHFVICDTTAPLSLTLLTYLRFLLSAKTRTRKSLSSPPKWCMLKLNVDWLENVNFFLYSLLPFQNLVKLLFFLKEELEEVMEFGFVVILCKKWSDSVGKFHWNLCVMMIRYDLMKPDVEVYCTYNIKLHSCNAFVFFRYE